MAVQKAIDNLKGKPQEDRAVVAGGIAGLVVIILLIAWGMLFLRRIQNGSQQVQFGGVQDNFNLQQVQQAQTQLQGQLDGMQQDLQQVRDAAAAREAGTAQQQAVQVDSGSDGNIFYGGQ